MRGDYKIVVLDHEVVHRHGRQVQFQRPPVRTVVEGHIYAVLGSRIEQAALLRIFADGAHERTIGNAVGEFRPGQAVIAGLVDVRFKIVALMTINSHIGRGGIVGGSLNLADAAPFRQIFGRDVGPVLAFVARNLHQAVIGAHPQQALRDRRLGQREDRVVVLRTRIVDGDVATRNMLLALVVAREVGANRLPMHSAVGGFEQPLGCVIKRVGIVQGNQYGRGPLEAMLESSSTVSVRKLRLLGDSLHLPDALVETRDVALVVGGIDNVRVRRIRRDVAGLASAHVIPVGAIDGAVITAAGDGHRTTILLRSVNPVRQSRVGSDVIELCRRLIVFACPILATI